ncbi:MAG TPA: DUF2207 domain-containing protein [Thermoanaerobaculia bacterium]|nr:DUF2207 domain-containing protein [Thermoanaerobaculia bacterium]
MRKPIIAAGFLALLVALPLLADRSLSWSSVDVEAKLDADGRLHVRERQAYVFDGDWNGGERTFRLEPGQALDFRSITRVDPATGAEVPLTRGGLDEVDHYDFTDERTLRWRSRLPSDPPFQRERITYVLDYTLSNILVQRGDGYLLDHEFLFSERAGPIERFTLDLEIDPAWRASEQRVQREIATPRSGEKALVRLPLEYVGAGAPDARPDKRPRRAALIGAVAGGILLSWLFFAIGEKRVGRFDPLPDIDRAWIEKNLLPIKAEVVGAAWDGSVEQSEVAALLARLVAEKKIKTETIGSTASPDLRMKLLVPRDEFSGYEKLLVEKFFFDGKTVTDTGAIRGHYKSTGLNPASLITTEVTSEANSLLGEKGYGVFGGCVGSLLFLICLVAAGFLAPAEVKGWAIGPAIALFVLFLIASGIGSHWQKRADFGRRQALWLFVPWLLMLLPIALMSGAELPLVPQILLVAAAITAIASTASFASSKQGAQAVEFRRKLAAVRAYFRRELAAPNPALDDDWFPYVLAFGLGNEAEKWFSAFGPASSGASAIAHSSSSSSSSSGGGSSWTGGGGAFGGAGASGTWVAAATGVAAGVASPSSSSSGGGGGGGGGSSGGGGGGGW